jgi:eukaryotic-like serine/threonine-protein kinase
MNEKEASNRKSKIKNLNLSRQRWREIDELFDAVLDLPAGEREKFLSEQVSDESLKNEIRSLLKAKSETDKFLETQAIKIAAGNLADQETYFSSPYLNESIGTFNIERLLGVGGMGEVYLAQDEKLKRKVALKILPAEYVSSNERVRRFQLEARAISTLNHPNIVTIYDVGAVKGINYIATEFVEGKTVRELIKGNLKINDILSIIIQSCEALSAAHFAGIIHRDIKPENIMVRPDGYVKILDFGVAKLSDYAPQTISNLAKTAKGVIIGTPAYMSPEQVAGEKIDHRTDLWSLGVVLYELLTGVNPFKKENRQATFQAILSAAPPPASDFNAEIPAALDQILMKALEKDAELSYQTATDLCADLKRVQRQIESPSAQNIASKSNFGKAGILRKNRYFFTLGTLAILILILVSSWFLFFQKNEQTADAPDWSLAKNVRLTDQAGTEFYPSLSPDGKTFIYAARSDNNQYDIFSQRVVGKNPVNLTKNSTSGDLQQVFSPDGERIAFRSEREPSGIYVMGASGENPRRVANFGFHPSWSPDGKEIVVSTISQHIPQVRHPSSLWIVNVESGERRLLVENFAVQPAWSPGGNLIAFWFTESRGRRDVAVISPNGGEPIVITNEGNTNWNPVWSPDGKFLYFASDRGGSMAFWRVSIDENSGKILSEPEVVFTPAKYNRHLSFSRDGKRMIYVQTINQSNLKAVRFDAKNEKPVGEPFWVTKGDREINFPELSPDGKTFAAYQLAQTQEDIILKDTDGKNQRELTSDKYFDRYPRWSPDGKKLIFASDRSGKYEIWMIDADGTNLKQITSIKDNAASIPAWSPNGSKISFDDAKQSYILDLTKEGTEPNLIKLPETGGDSFFRAWDWSSDGKKIIGYFEGGEQLGLAVYSLETNSYKKLNDLIRFPYWLPDNRRIVYADGGKVIITDTESERTKQIDELSKEQVRQVRISRDGSLLYYTHISSESDIWLLDLTQN